MRFFLVIVLVTASVAGVHFSGIISAFQENMASPEKMRAVKPEFIQNKVDEAPVYTFFETLSDRTMTQYVDLKGKLMPTALPPEQTIAAPSGIKETPPKSPLEKTATLELATKLEEVKTLAKPELGATNSYSGSEVPPHYAVQVSSFQDEARAGALKMRLQKNGFDAFLIKTELARNGGTWHRVFLGRYTDEKKAQEAAQLARSEFKLNAVVVRKTE
jgi:cell division septation protein DedD